jgi:hypothetical protein
MSLFLPCVLYTFWCLSKPYAHNNICKENNLLKKKEKEDEKKETKEKHNSTDRN